MPLAGWRDRLSVLTCAEKELTQQRFFLEMHDLAFIRLSLTYHLAQAFAWSKNWVVREALRHSNPALDRNKSVDESRHQNMMRMVAPQIETVQ